MHIAAVNRDLGAVLGEEPRDARSDPARAARDKSHFILEQPHVFRFHSLALTLNV